MGKDEKKQKLLDIALELFVKNGMAKTTILQITKEANIGKSTFYEYFKSKEDVINQWFESFFMQINGMDEFLQNIPSNKQKILTFARACCAKEFTNESTIIIFIEFWRLSFSQKDKRSLELINLFYENTAKQLKVYINDGIKNKEFKECDVDKVIYSLMALMDGHWIQFMANHSYDLEQNVSYSMEVFLEGISYG